VRQTGELLVGMHAGKEKAYTWQRSARRAMVAAQAALDTRFAASTSRRVPA
jgi:hypothetical protein